MLSGKEILVAISSGVITVISMFGIIKLLLSNNIANLREALLELKSNDRTLFDRINELEKCITSMKKDITYNNHDIYNLQENLDKCKKEHER